MPIVDEDSRPKRRRTPLWTAVLALLPALPLGLFAWSWFEPQSHDFGNYNLQFGALYGPVATMGPGWHRFPNGWQVTVELPGRIGLYDVSWLCSRDSNKR
jgi:hypothetical protein